MSYPQQQQPVNDPPQQVPQPQPAPQQPAAPQQQRGPVIVHTQPPQDNSAALQAQLQQFGEQLAAVPERLVQAFRESQPPQQPPQQYQQPQQPQQPASQQPQQQGTGLSASPQSPPPASPASGPPAGEPLPPGMSPTRARVLRSFFGR